MLSTNTKQELKKSTMRIPQAYNESSKSNLQFGKTSHMRTTRMISKGYTKKTEADEHYPERLIVCHTKEIKKENVPVPKEQKDLSSSNLSATTSMAPLGQPGQTAGGPNADRALKQTTDANKQSTADLRPSLQTSSQLESSDSESARRREKERVDREKRDRRKKEKEEKLKESIVDIEIEKSKTRPSRYIPGELAAEEDKTALKSANEKYEKFKKEKVGSDMYSHNFSQTLDPPKKVKATYCREEEEFRDEEILVKYADLKDKSLIKDEDRAKRDFDHEMRRILRQHVKQVKTPYIDLDPKVRVLEFTPEDMMASSTRDNKNSMSNSRSQQPSGGATGTQQVSGQSTSEIRESSHHSISERTLSVSGMLKAESEMSLRDESHQADEDLPEDLLKPLKILERLLGQSNYHKQQVLYKNYPFTAARKTQEEKKDGPTEFLLSRDKEEQKKRELEFALEEKSLKERGMRSLFQYECGETTKDRYVSCMDWNDTNPDLLAVSYGEPDHIAHPGTEKREGLLLFWTLKNPKFPERTIKTKSRITACQFSKKSPSLIAAGDYDGGIYIYDIRQPGNEPIASSKDKARDFIENHRDTINEVKWVYKGEKGEVVVSIGADGRINEWSLKKGLDYLNLKRLKMETNPARKKEGHQRRMFTNTSGLSIDFSRRDPSIYFAATDDGTIHRCSTSYTEQYLDTFFGHHGPVYKVRCNPFSPDYFLTCSYDWTARLWSLKDNSTKMIFSPPNIMDQINDIEWSPNTSTIFSLVADDGRVELWDCVDPLQPLISGPNTDKRPKTAVRFSATSPVLVTGNAGGIVEVFRLTGLETEQLSDEQQQRRLEKAVEKAERLSRQTTAAVKKDDEVKA